MIAEWMRDGEPPMDLWSVDVRRNMPFQSNRKYLRERVTESLGLLYATHWPYRQYETSRNVRTSALHERLARRGACFGEAFGWERANWYAPQGVEPVYEYSYGRQNWFEHSPGNISVYGRMLACLISLPLPSSALKAVMHCR